MIGAGVLIVAAVAWVCGWLGTVWIMQDIRAVPPPRREMLTAAPVTVPPGGRVVVPLPSSPAGALGGVLVLNATAQPIEIELSQQRMVN